MARAVERFKKGRAPVRERVQVHQPCRPSSSGCNPLACSTPVGGRGSDDASRSDRVQRRRGRARVQGWGVARVRMSRYKEAAGRLLEEDNARRQYEPLRGREHSRPRTTGTQVPGLETMAESPDEPFSETLRRINERKQDRDLAGLIEQYEREEEFYARNVDEDGEVRPLSTAAGEVAVIEEALANENPTPAVREYLIERLNILREAL